VNVNQAYPIKFPVISGCRRLTHIRITSIENNVKIHTHYTRGIPKLLCPVAIYFQPAEKLSR